MAERKTLPDALADLRNEAERDVGVAVPLPPALADVNDVAALAAYVGVQLGALWQAVELLGELVEALIERGDPLEG
ncbi:MAG: hypothetical protein M3046_08415 [Actinomycetota bacterium]|nr:hypothetical protein [Actinomycetota bacterium]